MQKILVPTDFSKASLNSFNYAIGLAQLMDAKVIDLVHVYSPEVEGDYPTIIPPINELMEVRKQQLKEFQAKASLPEGITVQSELLIGFAVDEIKKRSSDYTAIVMSTTGEGGILEKIFGSVSSAIAQKSRCPVFLIPPEQEFGGYSNILYASNYESAEDDMIESIIEFNEKSKACIHFVHVKDKEDFSKSKAEIFDEMFDDGQPKFSFEFEEINNENVVNGLNEYASSHPVDLVVMVNKQRNFWEGLFHKSKVREMVFAAQKPMMVMHLDD
jgi:nucleotide-binding universal stress UspA family protein